MPTNRILHDGEKILEVVYSGIVSAAELRSFIAESIKIAVEQNFLKVLTDCSKLEGGHFISDNFETVNKYETIKGIHKFREAILAPENEGAMELVKFYELACHNRGFKVKLFTERGNAIQWLQKQA